MYLKPELQLLYLQKYEFTALKLAESDVSIPCLILLPK